MKTLVYLATPYSHPDASVREQRFHAVNKAAADLIRKGIHVFSPISHTHSIALAGSLPQTWEYWKTYDRAILVECFKLIVLTLDGWKDSKGVTGEIAIARELGLEIEYLAPKLSLHPLGWWCGKCECFVSSNAVTYQETHDPHWCGCGEEVEWRSPKRKL